LTNSIMAMGAGHYSLSLPTVCMYVYMLHDRTLVYIHIVLYLYIYIALLAVHTNQKRSSARDPIHTCMHAYIRG